MKGALRGRARGEEGEVPIDNDVIPPDQAVVRMAASY
jgi:hypothetical protein